MRPKQNWISVFFMLIGGMMLSDSAAATELLRRPPRQPVAVRCVHGWPPLKLRGHADQRFCRHLQASGCNPDRRNDAVPCSDSTAATASPWIPLFDGKSLEGWKVANFGGEGEVTVEQGQVMMGFGVMLTGITYSREFPQDHYEIRYEAKRLDGIDFFGSLTFPVAESYCTFIAGGWAGAVVGLSNLDGLDASENETTKYMNFDDDRWYRFQVRVHNDRIEAWIDGQQVIAQSIQDRKVETRPEVDLCKPLGIAAWQSRAALRKIEFRRLEE